MDLRIFTEPQQGASYETLRRVAVASEEAGYDAFFRSDHYLTMGGDGLPGPTDAWTTLAALARDTSRVRLGTLVTSATFRHPGVLAIQVAQVDEMSGGRVEFGLGTGWYEQEHAAYGIPFPPLKERFDRFAEQLEIITGLWSTPVGETYDFTGEHYRIEGSPALPKPAQAKIPLIVGGGGKRRTPALAAQHADEFNLPFAELDDTRAAVQRVREACEARGRDAGEITFSAALVLCCGRDEAEVVRRAEAIGREPAELREHGLAGTPAEVVDTIGRYAEVGITRFYLQVMDLSDLEHLDLVAQEVRPQL
ncbi:LLM class F420-dependent oxidoreductase [Paenibacillus sp. TRM 82003]|uniref:LLM class F420-dependent oxidoreductase n=1 Tax=Kineococcus sp. TRM81007 TaxID=2925831 RepID=UPI001F57B5AC|nr:LLM class F420-dependent oxidoreductase [Kineococcus sp. TRM81007]MCI2238563.1 LLM class F420-dependent oxidoreductase [Kineococcus sp. TRM81007]MCI3920644.1 LLM class F420-dependent oxidoreductase [Paenibacillus sp. TRM 82003]